MSLLQHFLIKLYQGFLNQNSVGILKVNFLLIPYNSLINFNPALSSLSYGSHLSWLARIWSIVNLRKIRRKGNVQLNLRFPLISGTTSTISQHSGSSWQWSSLTSD